MRVLVVGGGVMGCATALDLAQRGVREVIVLERAVPGAEASSAAAGMLAAEIEAKNPAERERYVRARDGYGAWAAELRELTGIDIGHRKSGALSVARDQETLARMSGGEILDLAGVRAIEPEISGKIAGAAYFADEAQVDPPQLLRALVAAAARAGVTMRSGATVARLVVEGDRCTGVALEPETLHADAIVLAAGSWSSLVPGVPLEVPRVRPVRGQLALLEERPPRLRTIVFEDHSYVVPRGDGRVICGSTMEDVGHKKEVTASGLAKILGAAIAMAPRLGEAEMVRAWSNFRPHAASGAPLVGASPLRGLFLATGHHRNGILLARVTATAVADAIMGAQK